MANISKTFTENGEAEAKLLEELIRHIPETISLDDLKHHEWLRRIVVSSDDISNRVDYRAMEWAKSK